MIICTVAIISACHIHQPAPTQRLRKRIRLTIRVLVAIIILCLPLAKNLSSLDLVGTTTSLTWIALVVEIWGTSRRGDRFWSNAPRLYEAAKKRKGVKKTSGGGDSPTETVVERGGESDVSTLAEVGPGQDSVPAYWCG